MNKELYGSLWGDATLYMGMLAKLTGDTRELDDCQGTDGMPHSFSSGLHIGTPVLSMLSLQRSLGRK